MRSTAEWNGKCTQCDANLMDQFQTPIELYICSMDGMHLCSIAARQYICSQCQSQTIVLPNCKNKVFSISVD